VTRSGCCCRHTFRCLSYSISFVMCRSDPVLSENGSVMTTGVGEDGNREVGWWDRLPITEELITVANSLPIIPRNKYWYLLTFLALFCNKASINARKEEFLAKYGLSKKLIISSDCWCWDKLYGIIVIYDRQNMVSCLFRLCASFYHVHLALGSWGINILSFYV